MKTTKGGKVMNPTDAYRKEIRKRELKRVIFFLMYFLWVINQPELQLHFD